MTSEAFHRVKNETLQESHLKIGKILAPRTKHKIFEFNTNWWKFSIGKCFKITAQVHNRPTSARYVYKCTIGLQVHNRPTSHLLSTLDHMQSLIVMYFTGIQMKRLGRPAVQKVKKARRFGRPQKMKCDGSYKIKFTDDLWNFLNVKCWPFFAFSRQLPWKETDLWKSQAIFLCCGSIPLNEFFIQLCNGRQGMPIDKKVHLPSVGHPVMFSEVLMHECNIIHLYQ